MRERSDLAGAGGAGGVWMEICEISCDVSKVHVWHIKCYYEGYRLCVLA